MLRFILIQAEVIEKIWISNLLYLEPISIYSDDITGVSTDGKVGDYNTIIQ